MIKSLLIANRGEIACRICRTAKRLGIYTIAVYSDADRAAKHVREADIAYPIGPAPATDSYLNIDTLLTVANAANADAIHPGYGFLSENAEFARRCQDAGLIFVGPPAQAISTMGSKSAAKALMVAAGVPVVPGYHGESQDLDTLATEAERCGYPILLKASAGGGGKGMRIVETAAELPEQLDAVKREAASSFGDDRVLIERYLQNPRHIEIQVFADRHRNFVHLFERDCSIQRRHQKIIEEAPAPGLSPDQRDLMGQAAVDAAAAINYEGAGTVEFIAEGEQFYFMEMNTRLQVEHPVTEMITGQDLVEWQLKVANGEPLPQTQDQLWVNGHSVEVRLYAEDTDNEFLPSTGKIEHLHFPAEHENLRIDSGVEEGDEVSIFYDPMIAKVISHAATRDQAIDTLLQGLRNTQLLGVRHNIDYLQRMLDSAAFRAADLSTGFIEKHATTLSAPKDDADKVQAVATVAYIQTIQNQAKKDAVQNDGWRLNTASRYGLYLEHNSRWSHIAVTLDSMGTYHVNLDEQVCSLKAPTLHGTNLTFCIGDQLCHAHVFVSGRQVGVRLEDALTSQRANAGSTQHKLHTLTVSDLPPADLSGDADEANLVSPMPGKVLQVLVSAGDEVEQGSPLMIIEAMKMEHTIRAPHAGTVETVNFAEGAAVANNEPLLTLN